jgi:glutathione peroxidase
MATVYQFEANDYRGKKQALEQYHGKVLLIVNTASACGFTPQYQGLQQLQENYETQGFSVLAFPCNQFKQQEQGSNEEVKQFCDLNFNITFPLFSKIEVNGDNTHPLYQYLKQQAPGLLGSQGIKWNFTKFLVGKNGEVLKRYATITKPEAIAADIEAVLKKV